MTRTMILLFNHTLTPDQERDAQTRLGVYRFMGPPKPIADLWAQIPPELESLSQYLTPVREWLQSVAAPGDVVLIQGDFGACCLMVRWAFGMGLAPVYSTTRREAVEKMGHDGSVQLIHRFRHVAYRHYGL